MKKITNNIQKVLLLVIGVLAVILAALLIHKAYEMYQEKQHQEEMEVRQQEIQSELEDIQMQIKELAGDGEALQEFLNEKVNMPKEESYLNTEDAREVLSDAIVVPEEPVEAVPEEPEEEPLQEPAEETKEEPRQETAAEGGQTSVTANELYGDGDAIIIDEPEPVKPKKEPDSVSVNNRQEEEKVESVSVNQVPLKEPEVTISGNGTAGEKEEKTISGNAIVNGEVIPFRYVENWQSLEERRSARTSFVETMQVNGEDKAQISGNSIDFSDMKIACLGDSLTAGSNMNNLEDYARYSYPAVLKNILNAETVYNLGIGGSSYGRYWDQAFVDRYKEIPEDADIILVMGGTNDGFAASVKEMGNINEKKKRTFYGDVDELMKGLKKDYPNAKIIFATPLPNVLHDYLMNQRDYLLPQSAFADAIKQLAAENDIDVIDLYNSNILDTHDAQVISTYMPDGVHGNPAGYQVLAEHFASEIIRIMERDALYGGGITVSGNSPEEDSISGNSSKEESISGNSASESVSSNNGAGAAVLEPDPDTVSANNAARAEAERKAQLAEQQRKAQELSAEELEEIRKNNEKAAGEAMVIPPAAGEEAAPPEEKQPEEEETTAGNYEYRGEAIVIQ